MHHVYIYTYNATQRDGFRKVKYKMMVYMDVDSVLIVREKFWKVTLFADCIIGSDWKSVYFRTFFSVMEWLHICSSEKIC